jgi:hypothetical protein
MTQVARCYTQIQKGVQKLGLKHFKPIKPIGVGDTGSYYPASLYNPRAAKQSAE